MQIDEAVKLRIKQAIADGKNPNIKGKMVSFDGGLMGSVSDEDRAPFITDEAGIKRGITDAR